MPRTPHFLIAAALAAAAAAACADEPTAVRALHPRRDAADADVVVEVPDSVPESLYADSNVVPLSAAHPDGARTLRDVVLVLFRGDAGAEARADAVARVGGAVVGGRRLFGGDGVYLVRVPLDATQGADSLAAMPEVAAATPELMSADGDDWLAPRDAAGVGAWTVSPDSSTTDANWAFERVGAPLAWGCATGDAQTSVAVVDRGFVAVADVAANAMSFPDERAPNAHGTMVSSILAARGDDGAGMAGMMWHADLQLYSRASTALPAVATTSVLADAAALAGAVAGRARVITLAGTLAPEPARDDAAGAARQAHVNARVVGFLAALLRRAESFAGAEPLYVFSAGNVHADSADGAAADAAWNSYPALRDSFPSRVLVVAASGKDDALLASSKRGPLVEIAAPGESVLSLDADGALRPGAATSAATPLVAGAAGLLFSFDPTLSAEQVKRYLVAGARAGARASARASARATGADGYPILDAYAALQLAASRDGAPLCGQRLWYDGESLVVDRDTAGGRVESVPLALGPEAVRFVVPAEGGRDVYFYHEAEATGAWAVGRATVLGPRQWDVTPDATDAWESLGGGSLGRLRLTASRDFAWGGTTRGGDSTVWVEATYAAGYADPGAPVTVRQAWRAAVRGAGHVTRLAVWLGSTWDDMPGQGTLLGTIALGGGAPDSAASITAVFDGPGDHVWLAVRVDGDPAGARLHRLRTAPGAAAAEPLADFPAGRVVSHLAASDDGRQLGITYAPAPGECAVEYRDARRLDRVLRAVRVAPSACAPASAAPNFAPNRLAPRRGELAKGRRG